jgi:transcriptional activator for dhaKLM operon
MVDEQALSLMRVYHWPGNIRELEAVLERAAIQVGASEVILPAHLPDFIRQPQAWFTTEHGIEKVSSIKETERESILRAAKYCHGNLTQMSQILGIGRTTLWRRLKHWDISVDQYRNR